MSEADGSPVLSRSLPDIDLEKLDPAVASLIRGAQEHVRAHKHSADGWGQLGMVLLAHDLFAPAADCFSEASQRDPVEPLWPYFESISVKVAEPEKAVQLLRKAIKRFGQNSTVAQLRLAEQLIDLGQFDEAEHILDDVMNEGDSTRGHIAMARLCLLKNNPRGCMESVERAQQDRTPRRVVHLLLAEAHRRLGDAEAAERERMKADNVPDTPWFDFHYNQILKLRTGLKAELSRADRLFQQNRVEASIRLLNGTITAYPDSEWARILLARGLIRARRLKEAQAALAEALRLAPESFEAHFRMGVALQVGGQHERAAEWYEKTVALKPSCAVAYKNLGVCCYALQNRADAETQFKRAVAVQPDYVDGHLALGEFYLKERNRRAAHAAFNAASRLRPNDRQLKQRVRQLEDEQ